MRYLAAVSILLASVLAAFAQDASKATLRSVQLEPSFPEPVKIVTVLLDGAAVKPGVEALPANTAGVSFQAGNDWFNHLTIVLRNVSAKKIVYADIHVFFLDLGDGTPQHPMVGDGNAIGERPKHARYSTIRGAWQNDPARNPILIEPGQEASLPAISPERFEEIKEVVESRRPLSSIKTIRIGLATVYFEDGTKWAGGYFRPDFSAPGKYLHISRDEFDAYRQEASQ